MSSEALAAAHDHCTALVRAGDEDRWRAALFAAAELRPYLHALYAFNLEVARVRDRAREPLAGEVRLQWWLDALAGEARGDVEAHPVALALLDAIDRFRLPGQACVSLVEARRFDLYDDPMPTTAQLEGYCGETSSVVMRLATIILAGGQDPGYSDAAAHGGVAYAIAGLLRSLPWHARRGQIFLPRDILDRHGVTRDDIVTGRGGPGLRRAATDLRALSGSHLAAFREAARGAPRAIAAGLLPATLTPLYLTRMAKAGYDPLRTIIDAPPLAKLWRLLRASRNLAA